MNIYKCEYTVVSSAALFTEYVVAENIEQAKEHFQAFSERNEGLFTKRFCVSTIKSDVKVIASHIIWPNQEGVK